MGRLTYDQRDQAWIVELAIRLISGCECAGLDVAREALAEIRALADEDPDPTTGGALLRITDALEGVVEDR